MAWDTPPPRGRKAGRPNRAWRSSLKDAQANAANARKHAEKDKRLGKGYSPWQARRWGDMLGGSGVLDDPNPDAIRGKVGSLDDATLDLSSALGGGGTAGGYGGGSAGMAAADTTATEPVTTIDPLSNPEYLAGLAGIDSSESSAVNAARVKQDAARRALDDLLGEIADRQGKSEVRTRESQEGRGLLRSGATERLLADVTEAAGDERARGQSATAGQISELERAIAEAKIDAERDRQALYAKYAGLPSTL